MGTALIVLLLAAFACGAAWIILAELLRVFHARTWPTVTGQVLSSHWDASQGDSGTATYDVRIEYQYRVSGCEYRALKCIVGPAWSMAKARQKGAELWLAYPGGREVEIGYNPNRPAQSEIADGAYQRTNYGMLLLGLIWLGFCCFLAYRVVAGG